MADKSSAAAVVAEEEEEAPKRKGSPNNHKLYAPDGTLLSIRGNIMIRAFYGGASGRHRDKMEIRKRWSCYAAHSAV